MTDEIKDNIKNPTAWKRFAYMLLFVVALYVVQVILFVLIAFQFLVHLITNQKNKYTQNFGYQLSGYVKQILMYLTYNSEKQPFPFSEWPKIPKSRAAKTSNAAE